MKTKDFLQLLSDSPSDASISFTYKGRALVPAHYHVTEVKNVGSTSVDCGGNLHNDSSTVVQIHTSSEEDDGHRLQVEGYVKIFSTIQSKMDLNADSPIYFEYGDHRFHAASLEVGAVNEVENGLSIDLRSRRTACKPAIGIGENACKPAIGSSKTACC